MATRHKPVPIFSDDVAALQQMGVPESLAQQIVDRRDELAERFRETQRAIAEDDREGLNQIATSAAEAEVDAVTKHLPA